MEVSKQWLNKILFLCFRQHVKEKKTVQQQKLIDPVFLIGSKIMCSNYEVSLFQGQFACMDYEIFQTVQ